MSDWTGGGALVLSTSAISTFLRCPYQYKLSYVLRLRGAQSVAAAIGQAVHAGAEALHRGQPAEEALRAAWEAEAASVPANDLDADPDALPDALAMLRVYQVEVLPTFQPVMVEQPFTYVLDDVIVSGIIDAADEDVHDTKTRAGKTINGQKPSAFDPAHHDLQLTLYAFGYRVLTGHAPRRLVLDVLSRRGTYKQYEREPDVPAARDAISVVRDGIASGDYPPDGALNGACNWCPFSRNGVCGHAVIND